ncbi:zinc transporter ZIP3-like [Lycorma delicatula]|uniref:zinc transporter ZIP3-like n=1 Tax=Lycorma delicatula TaxID=130591 RepID=UPI003F51701D
MGEFYKNVIFTKLVCMIILGMSSLISGCLPLILTYFYDKRTYFNETDKINAERKKRLVISLLLSFTGGVLFCTVFIHLLPEVGEIFEELKTTEKYENLPEFLPQALLCFGFFFMYFVEELAHKILHAKNTSNLSENDSATMRCDSLSYIENSPSNSGSDVVKSTFIKNVFNITEEASKNFSFQERQDIINAIGKAIYCTDEQSLSVSTTNTSPIRNQPSKETPEVELVKSNSRSSVRSFLLALALSVHALFEGMAIGLEKNISSVWFMLLGVGSHKIVLSVCMGIEMVAGDTRPIVHVLYVTMFAIVSPAGAAAGMLLSGEEDVASALFQGIASGTLLYVLFFEVLKTGNDSNCDDENKNSGFTHFIVILLGFLLMTLLLILVDA